MTLLLLAGTGDARRFARFCANEQIDCIASLSGATRDPADLPIQTRIGGFGGEGPFKLYLEQSGISRVLDMTHPFATKISDRTARVCAREGIPYLRYERPSWQSGPGDDWVHVDTETQVADHTKAGQTVFLATGRQTLHRFANLEKCTIICRQIDPPDAPFPFQNGRFEIGRPPFSIDDEVALFRKLSVDVLVSKNAGGTASRSKLDAARALGIPVIMIKRPMGISGTVTDDLEQVKSWALGG